MKKKEKQKNRQAKLLRVLPLLFESSHLSGATLCLHSICIDCKAISLKNGKRNLKKNRRSKWQRTFRFLALRAFFPRRHSVVLLPLFWNSFYSRFVVTLHLITWSLSFFVLRQFIVSFLVVFLSFAFILFCWLPHDSTHICSAHRKIAFAELSSQ